MKVSTKKSLVRSALVLLGLILINPLINILSIPSEIVLRWIFSFDIDPLWNLLASAIVGFVGFVAALFIFFQFLMPKFDRLLDQVEGKVGEHK